MACFEDQKTLIVERFDGRLAPDSTWRMRLPQEDICQASGLFATQKYENEGGPGIEAIMNLLLAARNSTDDRRTFMTAQLLFWMLCAPDGHAKNFSVSIEPHGRFSLTPLYDVLSAYPVLGTKRYQIPPQKITMAMAFWGQSRHYRWIEVGRRHMIQTANAVHFHADVEGVLDGLVKQTPAAIAAVEERLPKGFPDAVATPILQGLLDASKRLR